MNAPLVGTTCTGTRTSARVNVKAASLHSWLRSADCEDVIMPSLILYILVRSFHVLAPKIWNMLVPHLKDINISQQQFKSALNAAITFTLVPVLAPVHVICTSDACMSGAFKVTHTNTNTCNSVAIKNLVKIVKYLEFLAEVYSTIADNVISSWLRQNYVTSLLCAL